MTLFQCKQLLESLARFQHLHRLLNASAHCRKSGTPPYSTILSGDLITSSINIEKTFCTGLILFIKYYYYLNMKGAPFMPTWYLYLSDPLE
jgi:hypothetical protein